MNFAIHKELVMDKLPTAFCHASTLVKLRDGGLMCCWFGGSHEGEADVAIYGARRGAAGSWSAPCKLADGVEANWNPVLFYRADGVRLLFYKEGQQIASWRTMVMTSQNDGLSWTAPAELLFKKAAPKTKAGFKEIDVKFYIPHIDVTCNGEETIFTFDCKITPTGSMKAVDLLNALNEHYALDLPVEMADIERLNLYRLSKKGNRVPMLNSDAVKLA